LKEFAIFIANYINVCSVGFQLWHRRTHRHSYRCHAVKQYLLCQYAGSNQGCKWKIIPAGTLPFSLPSLPLSLSLLSPLFPFPLPSPPFLSLPLLSFPFPSPPFSPLSFP